VVGAGASTLPAPPLCAVSFFRFAGGQPLHNIQILIFSNPTEDPSSRFAICSLKVFSNIQPAVFSFKSQLPSCAWILHSSGAFQIHPTSLPERPSFLSSTCKFICGPILLSSLFDRQSFMSASFALCHFCTAGRP
jgi:hypothetical protein